MPDTHFVRTHGTTFTLNGTAFRVSGFNCYFLAFCDELPRREVIMTAKQMGATVLRAWAFLDADDYHPGQVSFQYFEKGRVVQNVSSNGLRRLDALIQAAEDLEVKLILPLVNYWPDFGGMPAYVRWFGSSADVSEFYRNPLVLAAYRSWLDHIVTRRNALTGRLYSDEPSILAWELTNEARHAPLDWVEEMSAFVKGRDSNHLLALGDEGFFSRKRGGHLYDGSYGMDWEKNLKIKNMDFGTFHFYPQDWGYGDHLRFGDRWIRDHSLVGKALNKPVLLEEFGLRSGDRNKWYSRWMKAAPSGSLAWMLGHKAPATANFKDDFVIYSADELPAIAEMAG